MDNIDTNDLLIELMKRGTLVAGNMTGSTGICLQDYTPYNRPVVIVLSTRLVEHLQEETA